MRAKDHVRVDLGVRTISVRLQTTPDSYTVLLDGRLAGKVRALKDGSFWDLTSDTKTGKVGVCRFRLLSVAFV